MNLDLTDGSLVGAARFVTRQTLSCPAGSCSGYWNCTGGFYLGYDGALTTKLSYNASTAAVQAALEALPTLGSASDFGEIRVNASGGPTVCDGPGTAGGPAGGRNVTVELRGEYGNVYALTLINSLRQRVPYGNLQNGRTDGAFVNLTLASDGGTKENEYCSGRGWCDFATGSCMCNSLLRPPFDYEYKSSDGYGGAGNRGDCGHALKSATSCPTVSFEYGTVWEECGGPERGVCDNSTLVCQCVDGYYGADCMLRACAWGPSWWGEPLGENVGHADAECSNMGECERNSGLCACRPGFGGAACEKLLCPVGAYGKYCGGHGTCLPMWRIAEETRVNGGGGGFRYGAHTLNPPATWDSRRVHHCHCDSRDADQPAVGPVGWISGVPVENPNWVGGYTGYDCSRRRCPYGDDVHTPGRSEVQTVRCGLPLDETFRLGFWNEWTRPVSGNATALAVERALENLTSLSDVRVSLSDGETACRVGWGVATGDNAAHHGFRVTFVSKMGELPLLESDPPANVTRTAKGTKEKAVCGNRGYCDHETGLCECLSGFVGSDGEGNVGGRRDCGRMDPQGFTLNLHRG